MAGNSGAPVVIKRKKVVSGDGHHGGAWKVAYADFVTAMMAFFLLMWLLGATNEKQRKGIADFFNPTIPVNRVSGGGNGAFGGDSVFSENTLAQNGTGAGSASPTAADQARGDTGVSEGDSASDATGEDAQLTEIQEMFLGRGGESTATELLLRHVISRITDEGLIVEIFDTPDQPLFEPGTTKPTEALESLLLAVTEVFGTVDNEIAVQGHVAAMPLVAAEDPTWPLSQARADRVRVEVKELEIDPRRVVRVTGFAARKPVSNNPMSVRNNRIEVILLRKNV